MSIMGYHLDENRDPPWLLRILNNFVFVAKIVPMILIAVLWLLAQAQEARGNDLLRLMPGAQPGAATALPHLKNRDIQRRSPSNRHQSQIARHKAGREFQRSQAERAWSGTVNAPAVERLPVLIRPTVFSYNAALQTVLRIAEGDRVIFQTSDRTGFLELERIVSQNGRDCRHFRQEVRTPTGAEISFGSACRMRNGQWRFARR